MTKPFNIGIAGLGTVGAGVIKILTQNAETITKRAGREIKIVAVSARTKGRDRGVDLSGYEWVDNTVDLANYEGLDAVVEAIGGGTGDAADLVRATIGNKCHVVTANKELLALHGSELAKIAEDNGVAIMYEAAIAGAIPVVKAIREGLAANPYRGIYGILNGTCNYILTKMRVDKSDFYEVLAEAKALGYAESDPTFDIEGIDAAHKLCLLTSIAFGVKPDFDALTIRGITNINTADIEAANKMGCRIKLIGIARENDGKIAQIMAPCLVPENSALGMVEGVYNTVCIDGLYSDKIMITGRGAGEGPTASSIVADLIDLARGNIVPTFGIPSNMLVDGKWDDVDEMNATYYVRINTKKSFKEINKSFLSQGISVNEVMKINNSSKVIIAEDISYNNISQALKDLGLITNNEKPCIMRIEDL